ncbi:MAG: hypothetical protein CEN91_282 [Candidatus Berkelbacteria bacterium Licking1014_85]|uniref:Uncharacterized protein n=1 Tax=Candidatus Berkelbacteria bacterium Licking1014_85 TaxID=2017148 RepID=A0A554LJZ5_9BACT|nr:MAG: hypothetical protein CEN91_282 [Candidatus Berkelbacteria bacterium Licking1014_85]
MPFGQGIWLYSDKDRNRANVDVSSNAMEITALNTNQAFIIPLESNKWNLLGNPYRTELDFNDRHVWLKIPSGSTYYYKPLSQAFNDGDISQAYKWDPATASYQLKINIAGEKLKINEGFWIKSNLIGAKLVLDDRQISCATATGCGPIQ